jgi:GT2 family glycosyltransferase
MFISIIIAVKNENFNLRECIEHCLKLNHPDFEILVLPDKEINLGYPKTRVIPTGELTPPQKRDLAIGKAKGEILAFLDDDTYPERDWLNNAIKHFSEPDIAAVGGPAVTAETDSLMQKASGKVYESWFVSGPYAYRYHPPKPVGHRTSDMRMFVDDLPSCNFLVRKSIFEELGGFNTKFWPGEDTFLCLRITRDIKKKIIYDPKVLVYHHRRRLFAGHLRQIANYALHRGYFVKRFPGNSLRFGYFIPSLFVLALAAGLTFSFLNPVLRTFFSLGLAFYLVTSLIFSRNKDFRLIFLVFWGIIFSHLTYGLYFVRGLFSGKLKEE